MKKRLVSAAFLLALTAFVGPVAAQESDAVETAIDEDDESTALSPDRPTPESGLLHDIEKIVESRMTSGWQIDRYELDKMMPDALSSVCATPALSRQAALEQLERRIAALGGPLEKAYRENGDSLDDLKELVFVTRARDLLAEAMSRAPSECPFWLRENPAFQGIQTDAGRVTLEFEGGGLLVLQNTEGEQFLGGGGAGRLLLAYGLSQHWSLLGGGEFGGAALFKQGDNATQLPIQLVVATPLVLRFLDLTWHYDAEVAPTLFIADGATNPGFRVGGLIGISTLRIRGVMPWAGFGMAFEKYFQSGDRPGFTQLKGGARIGLDWDF